MALFFDELVILGFHDVRDAPEIHAEFKKRDIDAAVVDHAYVISHLHLAVSFYRLKSETAHDLGMSPSRTARDVFAALSLSHNLDRILQVLPAGPQTTAVLVVLRRDVYASQAARVLDCVLRKGPERGSEAKAEGHSLASRHSGLLPFLAYAEVEKVMRFYGITERDRFAMLQSFTPRETHALAEELRAADFARTPSSFHAKGGACRCPDDGNPCTKAAIAAMAGAKALEQCVVNKLSLCDI